MATAEHLGNLGVQVVEGDAADGEQLGVGPVTTLAGALGGVWLTLGSLPASPAGPACSAEGPRLVRHRITPLNKLLRSHSSKLARGSGDTQRQGTSRNRHRPELLLATSLAASSALTYANRGWR